MRSRSIVMVDPNELEAFCNDALVAWLRPHADEARLERFLCDLPLEVRPEVDRSARLVRDDLREFLSTPFPGDQDHSIFASAVRAHLARRFPALSEAAIRALLDHGDWIY